MDCNLTINKNIYGITFFYGKLCYFGLAHEGDCIYKGPGFLELVSSQVCLRDNKWHEHARYLFLLVSFSFSQVSEQPAMYVITKWIT